MNSWQPLNIFIPATANMTKGWRKRVKSQPVNSRIHLALPKCPLRCGMKLLLWVVQVGGGALTTFMKWRIVGLRVELKSFQSSQHQHSWTENWRGRTSLLWEGAMHWLWCWVVRGSVAREDPGSQQQSLMLPVIWWKAMPVKVILLTNFSLKSSEWTRAFLALRRMFWMSSWSERGVTSW